MGIPGGANLLLAAGGVSGYEIDQSLRFDGSAYMVRGQTGGGGSRKIHTHSHWIKRSKLSSDQVTFSWMDEGSRQFRFTWGPDDRLQMYCQALSGPYAEIYTENEMRDTSAWYHLVVAIDTTQSNADDRMKLWVNGEQIVGDLLYYRTNFNQNVDTAVDGTSRGPALGARSGSEDMKWHGYIAEVHYVNGSALTADDFGEYDSNGVWVAKEYTGSHGTTGFYLDFSNSSDLGEDQSGNGEDWASATNFDTSGSTGSSSSDVVTDSPTNNFAVLNSAMKRQDRDLEDCVKEAGLRFKKGDGNNQYIASSIACPGSGKWYFEFTVNVHQLYVGVAERGTWENVEGLSSKSVLLQMDSSSNYYIRNYYTSSTQNLSGESSTGQVYSMRYDADNGTVAFYNASGTQFGSTVTGLTTGVERFFFISGQSGADSYCNFGQQDWAHTLPSGYKALCTANLPAPDVANGRDYFNTVLYTANASSKSISGVGFQPDWVWIKNRASNLSHRLYDAVRGTTKQIYSDDSTSEATDSNSLTSFDSDGFSINSSDGINRSGEAHVAWCWDAGGSGSSNTSGSITSTVSANATAGFSIVSYTGTGSAATVGHGLGVAPSMIIEKNRDRNQNWAVYHSGIGATKALILDENYASQTATYYWNDTEPTSTVFSVGTWNGSNSSGEKHIAYCFAEVEGYSKFGRYKANGTYTNGPFIYTGFKPAFVLYKVDTAGGNWQIFDNKRGPYNDNGPVLYPDIVQYEDNLNNSLDFLSNGFKLYGYGNDSPQYFIYAAFAENPFGGSGVSPVTAR